MTIISGRGIPTINLFCELRKATPGHMPSQAQGNAFKDEFADFVRKLESDGRAGSCIESFKKVVLSWTWYCGVNVQFKVNIKGKNTSPLFSNEHVPTREELSKSFV